VPRAVVLISHFISSLAHLLIRYPEFPIDEEEVRVYLGTRFKTSQVKKNIQKHMLQGVVLLDSTSVVVVSLEVNELVPVLAVEVPSMLLLLTWPNQLPATIPSVKLPMFWNQLLMAGCTPLVAFTTMSMTWFVGVEFVVAFGRFASAAASGLDMG